MKKFKKSIDLNSVETDINELLKYIEKVENLEYDEENDKLDIDNNIIEEEVEKFDKKIKEKYKDYLDTPKKNNTNKHEKSRINKKRNRK